MHLKISSAKLRPFCLGGDELLKSPFQSVGDGAKGMSVMSSWRFFFIQLPLDFVVSQEAHTTGNTAMTL